MPYLIDHKSNVSCIFKQITVLLRAEFHFHCPLISFHKILVIHHNLIDHKVLKRNIKISDKFRTGNVYTLDARNQNIYLQK